MSSPLDAPGWSVAPDRALRIAGVVFAGAAAVPALAVCPLVLHAFDMGPLVVWVTTASTAVCAYGVMRLASFGSGIPGAWKAFGLSIAGGAVNGLVSGALAGVITWQIDSSMILALYGAAVGIGYGFLFGVVNAVLAAIAARTHRTPSILSAQRAQRTAFHLSVAVFLALLLVVLVVGVDPAQFAHEHTIAGATLRSFELLLRLPLLTMVGAAAVAISSGRALGRRHRWLQRVIRGEDARYRVMHLADVTAAPDLAVFELAGKRAATHPEILVRVDVADDVDGGAYRSAEHLTPLARLR